MELGLLPISDPPVLYFTTPEASACLLSLLYLSFLPSVSGGYHMDVHTPALKELQTINMDYKKDALPYEKKNGFEINGN